MYIKGIVGQVVYLLESVLNVVSLTSVRNTAREKEACTFSAQMFTTYHDENFRQRAGNRVSYLSNTTYMLMWRNSVLINSEGCLTDHFIDTGTFYVLYFV